MQSQGKREALQCGECAVKSMRAEKKEPWGQTRVVCDGEEEMKEKRGKGWVRSVQSDMRPIAFV